MTFCFNCGGPPGPRIFLASIRVGDAMRDVCCKECWDEVKARPVEAKTKAKPGKKKARKKK